MNAVVIGAAKPGYAEAITRKLIKNGFKVIGTYDTEFEENATKLSKEFSSEKLTLKSLDLSSRNDLKSFVDDIVDPIDAFVFAQFYFDMENPDDFNHEIWDKSIAINLTAPNYCLKQVLLEGGECEVLMQMPKSKYFPSDYYFYAEHLLFEKNGEYIRQEIITLCSEFCLRKINIIAQDQELYINEIDKIQNLLQINGLSHVRLGIYIQSTFITNRMYNFLVEKKDVLYKITFLGNNLTSTQITRFQKLKEFDIKIKVILELFHEQATTQSIQFLIEAMRSGDVQVAPTALIAGKTLDLHLVQIQSILRTLFFKIFLPYYKKIIAYENNKKYEMRIGNSQQYSIIPKIEKEVNMLSQSLNELIFSILEELLSYMTLNEYETGDIIIAILKKYEDRITEVGGYIDANLFNSCRIQ